MRRFIPLALSFALLAPAPALATPADDLRAEVDKICKSATPSLGDRLTDEVVYEETDRYYRAQYVQAKYEDPDGVKVCSAVVLRRKEGGQVDLDTVQYGIMPNAMIQVPEKNFIEIVPLVQQESPERSGPEVDFIESELEDGTIALLAFVFPERYEAPLTANQAEYLGHPEWEGLDHVATSLSTGRYYIDLNGTQTLKTKVGPSESEVQAAKAKLSSAKNKANQTAKARASKIKQSSLSASKKQAALKRVETERKASIAAAERRYREAVKPRYATEVQPYASRLNYKWTDEGPQAAARPTWAF